MLVKQLANALARRGHAVEVVHCRDAYRATARRMPTAGYEDHQTGRPWWDIGALPELVAEGRGRLAGPPP